ncbi:MAG: ATP-binding protein [Bacteroidota bacterium]
MDEANGINELTTQDQELVLLISVGLGAMLLLALLVVFFFIYYHKRYQKQAQDLDFLQQKLINAEILTQENERVRVAKDLHDVSGSMLGSIKLFITKIKKDMPEEKHSLIKEEVLQYVDETISSIKEIVHQIVPGNLERFGLCPVLEELFHTYEKLHPATFEFQAELNERFNLQQELAVFRIIQELLNNTIKHAEASHISLNLEHSPEGIQVMYEDNGKGFDVNSYVKSSADLGGLGLKGIKSRISFLDAEYRIRSRPDEGMQLTFSFSPNPTIDSHD